MLHSIPKSLQVVCGSAAAIALVALVSGTEPAPAEVVPAIGFEELHADLSEEEMAALLEDREAMLHALQETLADQLEAEGRYHTFALDGGRVPTAPAAVAGQPSFPVTGMRVKVVRDGGGAVGRTILIPTGYDAVYDELAAEVQWLSHRLGLFETSPLEVDDAGV